MLKHLLFPEMQEEPVEFKFPLILIGDAMVGKSSCFKRYTIDTFSDEYNPTFCPRYTPVEVHKVNLCDIDITLHVYDTAGQERFRTLYPTFYRSGKAYILMYDVTDKCSFTNVKYWLQELERYASSQPNRAVMIVANKCDLPNSVVDFDMARDFALSQGFMFYEVSAKTGLNVQEMFEALIVEVLVREGIIFRGRLKSAAKVAPPASHNQDNIDSSPPTETECTAPDQKQETLLKKLVRIFHR